MNKDYEKKKITLTEEQSERAAETLMNSWLKDDDDIPPLIKNPNINSK
jgi:hypothetical protein